jgi:acetoin utilization deacetylase AcuC-like enzyme
VRIFYADQFVLPLPAGHRFPMPKYSALRERVAAIAADRMRVADAASDVELLRVHDAGYVRQVVNGTIDAQAMRRIGFPWS